MGFDTIQCGVSNDGKVNTPVEKIASIHFSAWRAKMRRREFLFSVAAAGSIGLIGPARAANEKMIVYKDPNCGCCRAWAEAMKDGRVFGLYRGSCRPCCAEGTLRHPRGDARLPYGNCRRLLRRRSRATGCCHQATRRTPGHCRTCGPRNARGIVGHGRPSSRVVRCLCRQWGWFQHGVPDG